MSEIISPEDMARMVAASVRNLPAAAANSTPAAATNALIPRRKTESYNGFADRR